MNRFMSVVISLAMLLGAAGKVCAQTDSAQVAAKQYREDIEAVLNRMVEAGAVSARARDSVIAVINSARSGSSQEQAAWLGDIRKEWVDRLSVINKQTESLMDLPAPEPAQYWTSMLPRTLPARPDIGDKGEWSVSRPLTVYEILERNRQLILTRMIQEDPTPEFLKDIQDNHPLWGAILMNLLGLLNIGGPFGNMDMLVTPVSVGGRPMFDDMIFLDPNFDPRVYQPSLPVPQYDPLDPSQPYKASIRKKGTSSEKGGNASGPPPVQQSKYVIP